MTAKGKKLWGPVVLSEGRLILRDMNEMKCVDVGAAR